MTVTAQMVKELRDKTGAGMLDCKKALVETNGVLDDAITWLREKGIAKAAKKADRVAAEGLCNIVVEGNSAIVYEVNCETDFVAKNDKFLQLIDQIGEAIFTSGATNTEEALTAKMAGKAIEDVIIEATATIGEKTSLRRVARFEKSDTQHFGAYKHQGGRIVTLTIVEGANAEVAKDVSMHVAALNPSYLDQNQISADELQKERSILRQEALNEGKPEKIVDKMVEGRLNKYLQDICLVNQAFVKNPDLTVEKYVADNKGSIIGFVRLEVGEGIEKTECDFAAEVMAQVQGK